jgi:hypothetical protein
MAWQGGQGCRELGTGQGGQAWSPVCVVQWRGLRGPPANPPLAPCRARRGASAWSGLERATADYVGMLATCMNALCLQVGQLRSSCGLSTHRLGGNLGAARQAAGQQQAEHLGAASQCPPCNSGLPARSLGAAQQGLQWRQGTPALSVHRACRLACRLPWKMRACPRACKPPSRCARWRSPTSGAGRCATWKRTRSSSSGQAQVRGSCPCLRASAGRRAAAAAAATAVAIRRRKHAGAAGAGGHALGLTAPSPQRAAGGVLSVSLGSRLAPVQATHTSPPTRRPACGLLRSMRRSC